MDAWKLFRTSRRIFFPTFSNFRLEQSGHVLIYRWCDVNNIVKFCDRSKYRVDTSRFTSREKRTYAIPIDSDVNKMEDLSFMYIVRQNILPLVHGKVPLWQRVTFPVKYLLFSPFFFYIYPFPFRNFRNIPHHFSFSPDNNHRASRYHFFFVSFLLRALVKRNSATCCIIIIPPPLRIAEL